MTLKAEGGVLINDNFSGTVSSQQLNINADSNDSGSGTFTLKSGKSLTSNDGVLSITAADIQIQGTVTSGTAVTNIHTTNQRLLLLVMVLPVHTVKVPSPADS